MLTFDFKNNNAHTSTNYAHERASKKIYARKKKILAAKDNFHCQLEKMPAILI